MSYTSLVGRDDGTCLPRTKTLYSNEGRFVHFKHFDKLTMHVYEINIVTEILLKLPPEVAQQS